MTIERIIIVAALAIIGMAAYWLFKQAQMRKLSSVTTINEQAQLLYFRSATCAVCPTQSRFVDTIEHQWAEIVAIRKIDDELEPDTASKYGVFTLPTTILVDAAGKVREINYGLTNAHKLNQQLQTVLQSAN